MPPSQFDSTIMQRTVVLVFSRNFAILLAMENRENIGWDEALKSRMLARGHANGEGAVDGIDTTKQAYLVAFDDLETSRAISFRAPLEKM